MIFVCSPNGFLRVWLGGSGLKSVRVPRVPVRKSGDRPTVLSDADVCALCLSRVSNPLGGDMVTVQESAFRDIDNSYFLLVFIRFLASCDFRTYEQGWLSNCFTINICFSTVLRFHLLEFLSDVTCIFMCFVCFYKVFALMCL